MMASHMNPIRADVGLRPVRTLNDIYLAASVVLAFTAEPFEYPRSDWPSKIRLVGPGLWEPPAEPPAWLEEVDEPLVLVTCSTLFQNDRRLIEVACEAFGGEQLLAVVTTGEVDASELKPPPNVRIERFVPHTPVIERASCVVCHAGMGITQKALSHGVPVVAVPFGRDQPEVARRVAVSGAGVRLPLRALRGSRLRRAVDDAMKCRLAAESLARAFAEAGGPMAAADELEGLLVREAPAS
jgi:MGT family glycosyltransferase